MPPPTGRSPSSPRSCSGGRGSGPGASTFPSCSTSSSTSSPTCGRPCEASPSTAFPDSGTITRRPERRRRGMKIRTIDQMDLTGKRTLIRVDFNVPLDKAGAVTDDTRIKAALPTLRTAAEKGAVILLLSHLGRPKGKAVPEMSLAPVAPRLASLLGKEARFVPACGGDRGEQAAASARPGEILLLENVRFHPGEEKNDEAFGRQLAALCDVYVNDAFATAHRGHASNVAVTRFVREKGAGLLMRNEIAYFEKALVSPARQMAAVFGGAKISGKIEAINNVLGKVDKILIGGGVGETLFAAP